ncbi:MULTISPECIES: dihydroneopterin aldolase [Halanaerobium]|jgi:dihydroneopterin aldolase|uniref:7,8-dihydroneopterin aldolase n=1 Tax=Halanaerobium congolense TaxID=54121 RepID=A0A1M7NU08_9FIRM|nr:MULTISPECIES: dihydroneopterin aldolase [Halanaerobium]KXS49558.1 MAG: dihydroneopterin aldolase [Halanaerobium sp. T82-1]PTX17601.1 dihydroneopterin aldolase [Halanaerobium congolense]PUU90651.1 MAG: dihydroneopterin aldolase [Halanaerobium sp.]PUU92006.1 MAG: dihydroneopterin aldolase [Halanaerobium sp.]TDP12385.1 dihydroneopterin aldolase [Halanaerobium congolense]
MAGKDIIELNEMVFFAYHGVLDSEKELGQRFILNFKAELDYSKAAVNDNLEQTVNYAEIYYKIKEVFLAKKYDLLESAAYNIIKNLFIEFPKLELIEIKIKKPAVPIEGALANAAVKMSRKRTEVI